jgi:hypothetical protein
MSTAQEQPRDRVSAHGTFLSIPPLFDGADEGLRHAFKMEISPVVTGAKGSGKDAELTFGTTFLTDRALLDLGAIDPGAVSFEQVERDCDLLKEALQQHPEVVRQALDAVAGKGQDIDHIKAAAEGLERIHLTEQHAHEQRGGFVGLLLLACAIALCAGCHSCAHSSAGHRPPEHPHTTVPPDAGPH